MPRILIAEDEHDLREILQEELTDHNFDVTAVENGEEAIGIATDESLPTRPRCGCKCRMRASDLMSRLHFSTVNLRVSLACGSG